MRATFIATLLLMLVLGCARQPPDIAGDWTFVAGGRLSLTQTGSKVKGNGVWGDNPPTTIAVTGRVASDQMTFVITPPQRPTVTFHYDLSISPKGNQRFLKCREWIGGSLIPAGINYWEYDILKKKMTELRKGTEGSQHPAAHVFPKAASGL